MYNYRQSHKAFFEKSDLFFVCKMQPLSFDVQKQDSEIEAAKVNSIVDYESYVAFFFIDCTTNP